ncbi:MAG: hypothetical protein Q7J26_12045 [Brevundimonas sp.]|uniref:hypothetical protein n=1 Tax=Brevundimonas sp. TaxID=1871086 RepID=UPI0027238A47|nr:hypothetical protein [Brevundimonas sp.]MDO9609247.1 hypothetical protein [Brevundimonas sp.]
MKSFRTPAVLGAVATVLLTSGAAFAGTVPASTASAATARPAATSSARPQRETRHARHHRAETPKIKPAKSGKK